MNSVSAFLKKNWMILVFLVYLFSPIDVIPDILPVVGQIDEATLVILKMIMDYRAEQQAKEDETVEVDAEKVDS